MTEQKQELKAFIRVLNTDLDENKQLYMALRKIYGVNYSLSNAICNLLKISKTKKAGLLTDEEVKRVEASVREIQIPKWMINRRKDLETGNDQHLIGGDLKFAKESDVKRLKRIRSYRGMRHAIGQPTRGQRTRSHFRHGRSVGVQKQKVAGAAKSPAKPTADKGGKGKK